MSGADAHALTPVPTVFDQVDPGARGEAHGELWRDEIRTLVQLRTEMAVRRNFGDEQTCLRVAALHLPVLAEHAPELHAELLGISRGSGSSPEAIVVLNHYTDLVEVPSAVLGAQHPTIAEDDAGGCTALYVSGNEGPMLGQTWDMHASVQPYVRTMLIAPHDSDERTVCFTLTGCLGMAGMGPHKVAVTINNLRSTDGQVGLVWPALVRMMLAQKSATAAYERLCAVPLSSGHHYMIADGAEFYGVECSGQLKVLTQRGAKAGHVHTNHCFDPVLRQREQVPRGSTTFERMNLASTLMVQHRPRRLEDLWALLASHDGPVGLCVHGKPGDPESTQTCGAVAMELGTGRIRFSHGCLHGAVGELVL